jgi:hypothetical protein
MQAIRNIPPLPPTPPPWIPSQPESVSPYNVQIKARSLMKQPHHLGGGADPEALDILLVDGNDTMRNAPVVQFSPDHINIEKMSAAYASGDLGPSMNSYLRLAH